MNRRTAPAPAPKELRVGLFRSDKPARQQDLPAAVEEDPGIQARLFALVPSERIIEAQQENEGAEEPWKASVPSFEDTVEDDDDDDFDDPTSSGDEEEGEKIASILLGHIVRFSGDRRHADDLAAEAVDILQKIVNGGDLRDADSRAVDDLLDSI